MSLRSALYAWLVVALAGCGARAPAPASAPPTAATAAADGAGNAPAIPISDPAEYAIDHVSREAGEAIFAKHGVGDPYRTGMPYPVFLALFRAFPETFGHDFGELAGKYGFVARAPDPHATDDDLRAGLPIGMHLTIDPITRVPFVVTSCALCHAEKLRWPGGEATVIGLANKRVRIHAYDAAFAEITTQPAFTVDKLGRLAREAADAAKITWPDAYATPIVAATLDALRRRATERADLRARTVHATPGRVATIDSFVGVIGQLSHHSIQYAPQVGWAKVPDVIGFPVRTTLSWDGSGEGPMDLLAVEADVAAGVRVEWLQQHPFQGASLGAYLRQPAPRPAFPRAIDRRLADKGKRLFEDQCAHCHGHYGGDGRAIDYTEQVVPIEDIGTDPARMMAATDSFERAANDPALTLGYTKFRRTGGYVPPILTNVWMRGPFGHAGQWPSLAVLATPPAKRVAKTVDLAAPYDLASVGVATIAAPPSGPEQYRDDPALLAGHPFLADLGADAPAVIEYLKSL
jgi:mono/diheme cytochrome c family protein